MNRRTKACLTLAVGYTRIDLCMGYQDPVRIRENRLKAAIRRLKYKKDAP
jgi:hypothetical protein